jgi:hypothetical protein
VTMALNDVMYIPAGFMYFVYNPRNSIAVGGNFIVDSDAAKLLAVKEYLAEDEGDARFPNFPYLVLLSLREQVRNGGPHSVAPDEITEWVTEVSPIFATDLATDEYCTYMTTCMINTNESPASDLVLWARGMGVNEDATRMRMTHERRIWGYFEGKSFIFVPSVLGSYKCCYKVERFPPMLRRFCANQH